MSDEPKTIMAWLGLPENALYEDASLALATKLLETIKTIHAENEALRARVAELEEAQLWRDAHADPPAISMPGETRRIYRPSVLVVDSFGEMTVADYEHWQGRGGKWTVREERDWFTDSPPEVVAQYWRPLPAPPLALRQPPTDSA